MTIPVRTSEVHISQEVLSDVHQLRELLVGISALLQNPHRTDAVDVARGATFEARAVADRVVAHLDAYAAMQLEDERAERLHREEAAKSQMTNAAVLR